MFLYLPRPPAEAGSSLSRPRRPKQAWSDSDDPPSPPPESMVSKKARPLASPKMGQSSANKRVKTPPGPLSIPLPSLSDYVSSPEFIDPMDYDSSNEPPSPRMPSPSVVTHIPSRAGEGYSKSSVVSYHGLLGLTITFLKLLPTLAIPLILLLAAVCQRDDVGWRGACDCLGG